MKVHKKRQTVLARLDSVEDRCPTLTDVVCAIRFGISVPD